MRGCVPRAQSAQSCECRQALTADPFCFEAYEALMCNHMLTSEQERELLDSIDVHQDDNWLMLLYSTMCKKVRRQRGTAHLQPPWPCPEPAPARVRACSGRAAAGRVPTV
jgi:hypothetical protein